MKRLTPQVAASGSLWSKARGSPSLADRRFVCSAVGAPKSSSAATSDVQLLRLLAALDFVGRDLVGKSRMALLRFSTRGLGGGLGDLLSICPSRKLSVIGRKLCHDVSIAVISKQNDWNLGTA